MRNAKKGKKAKDEPATKVPLFKIIIFRNLNQVAS